MNRRRLSRLVSVSLGFVAALAFVPSAAGQELDAATGRLAYAPDVEVVDLSSPVVPVTAWELGVRPTDLEDIVEEVPNPLVRTHVLALRDRTFPAAVDLAPLDRFEGRRVEIRLWYRPLGTDAEAALYWGMDYSDLRRTSTFRLPLLPTGRGTSDGWRELSSGPVDWENVGTSPVLHIIDGAEYATLSPLGNPPVVAAPPNGEVWLDGLSVTDRGEAAIPDVACRFPDEDAACGEYGVCLAGRCVDGRLASGTAALTRERRVANLDRRHFMYEAFHAERDRVDKLPELRAAFDELVDAPAHEFVTGLMRAVRNGRFGHGLPPFSTALTVSSGLCLGPGVADMLPGSPQLPIVFWTDPDEPAYADVLPGDVLVAIDGIDVLTWQAMEEAKHLVPMSFYDEYLEQASLGDTAALRGSVLSFERCARVDGQPCDATAIDTYELDMADVFGDAVRNTGQPAGFGCDLRFVRPEGFSPNGQDDQPVGVDTPRPGIKVVAFNGFLPADFDAWRTDMRAALAGPASGIVFDTRTGNGGQATLVPVPATPVVDDTVDAGLWSLPDLPTDDARVFERVEACLDSPMNLECHMLTDTITFRSDGQEAPLADVPVALLLGRDGSASDYFPAALLERSGPLHIVGPTATLGWWAVASTTPRLGGEIVGTWIQGGDPIRVTTSNPQLEPPLEFYSGYRVPPDDVCLQHQSDAVRGTDTCLERALDWVEARP